MTAELELVNPKANMLNMRQKENKAKRNKMK